MFRFHHNNSILLSLVDSHPLALALTLAAFVVFCLGLWALRSFEDAHTDNVDELEDQALKGNHEAALRLGGIFAEGDGVTRDYAQAAKWWLKAAEAGLPAAQYNLARLYAKGEGRPRDPFEAARWYNAAAAQGDIKAQYEMGKACDAGDGVPQDYAAAAAWYKLAAEQGDPAAQAHLSKLYYRGCGVEKDLIEAFILVCLAAANHDEYMSLRNKMYLELTPEQKAAADARLVKMKRKGA